jgi:hypothetical protein
MGRCGVSRLSNILVDTFTSLGKKGIGLGKRARSPTAAERVAKMAKMAEETSHRDYRDHARLAYEERRAEGRLGRSAFWNWLLLINISPSGPAQRTCATLDEKAGKSVELQL